MVFLSCFLGVGGRNKRCAGFWCVNSDTKSARARLHGSASRSLKGGLSRLGAQLIRLGGAARQCGTNLLTLTAFFGLNGPAYLVRGSRVQCGSTIWICVMKINKVRRGLVGRLAFASCVCTSFCLFLLRLLDAQMCERVASLLLPQSRQNFPAVLTPAAPHSVRAARRRRNATDESELGNVHVYNNSAKYRRVSAWLLSYLLLLDSVCMYVDVIISLRVRISHEVLVCVGRATGKRPRP